MAGARPLSPHPTVSLIVPVFNEAATIEACLDSIRAQTYPGGKIETIVVDGRSTDETAAIVRAIPDGGNGVRLLDNPDRTMARGLNVGIGASAGEIVGVVSGHSALPPEYVERAVATLRRTGAWAVGGRITRVASTPIQRAIAYATASRFGVGDAHHNFEDTEGEVEAVFPGIWPRWVFDVVGGFDPEMVRNEDNEFSLRIRKAGGTIWLDPSITVSYVPRSSLGGLFSQYRLYAFGKPGLFLKHRGGLRPRHLIPAAWVGVLGAGLLASICAPPVRPPFGLVIGSYTALIGWAAVRSRRRGASVGRTFIAFVTLHLAYGIGFWQGVAHEVGRVLARRPRA